MKRRRLLLGGIVVVFLGTFFCSATHAQVARPAGTLKMAIHWSNSADWLDPATAAGNVMSPNLVLYLIHDALMKPMPEGTYTPSLAESWSISPDGKTFEFKLRRGVKFHNGDALTAEDVVFSFWRYKSAQAKFIHNKTEKVEAVNPHLVRISFKEPFPDFLDYLLPGAITIGWIVPKNYVEKVGDAEYRKRPIGCGPYRLVEFAPGVKLVAEAFEGYWRKMPHIKTMEFYSIIEPATRLAMIKRGEVDIASNMQGVLYWEVKKDPKLRLLPILSPAAQTVYIASQWDPKSPWSDPRVRKAASLAIDRKTLADVHMPGASPIGSIGLESDPLAVNFPPDPYDPEKAKKLLAEAGYPKGVQGGKFYPQESGFWPMGEQVANYWKAVGIDVNTELFDRPAWWANRQGGKMKGSVFTEPMNAPTIGGRLAYLFGPGSYGNYPDLQTLWDKYQKEVSLSARKDLITRIQELVYERTMWIPLISTVSPNAVGPRVKGNPFKVQPPKSFRVWFPVPFEDIELEK